MKLAATIALLPAIVIWAATPRPVPSKGYFGGEEIKPISTPVQIENITARRMDEGTFRARWAVVADLPPMIEVRREEAASNAGTVAEPPAVPPSRQTTAQTVRRVALRSDVCSRHGMRRVMVGKYRWRCRR